MPNTKNEAKTAEKTAEPTPIAPNRAPRPGWKRIGRRVFEIRIVAYRAIDDARYGTAVPMSEAQRERLEAEWQEEIESWLIQEASYGGAPIVEPTVEIVELIPNHPK